MTPMPPSELTRAADALTAAVAGLLPPDGDVSAFQKALSDLLAATLGGATTLAAGAVLAVDAKVDRLALEVAALQARQVRDADG